MQVRGEERDIVSFSHPFRPCKELLGRSHGEKLAFVGQRLFFLKDESDRNIERNRKFLEAYLRVLEANRILEVEGPAGCGKSALAEEIAMLYVSEGEAKEDNNGEYEGGYAIATNGSQTLTELRLYSYRDGSVDVLGPLAQMQKDAWENGKRRYVFILHEYNRVNDFMSLLGNLLESELRSEGPDSWWDERDERHKRHQPYSFGSDEKRRKVGEWSSNFKVIMTSNPPRGGFVGVVGNFMNDGALRHNRLLSARVSFGEDFSLYREKEEEQEKTTDLRVRLRKNKFPCSVIVDNLEKRVFTSTDARLASFKSPHGENTAKDLVTRKIDELIKHRGDGPFMYSVIHPGKIVAEVGKIVRQSQRQANEELWKAIERQNVDETEQTLRAGAQINAVRQGTEETALEFSCKVSNRDVRTQMIRMLIRWKAKPFETNTQELPVEPKALGQYLLEAAMKGETLQCIVFHALGASPEATDNDGQTALMLAEKNKHSHTVRALKDLNAGVEAGHETPCSDDAEKEWREALPSPDNWPSFDELLAKIPPTCEYWYSNVRDGKTNSCNINKELFQSDDRVKPVKARMGFDGKAEKTFRVGRKNRGGTVYIPKYRNTPEYERWRKIQRVVFVKHPDFTSFHPTKVVGSPPKKKKKKKEKKRKRKNEYSVHDSEDETE
ncbi:hypothetical protein M9434_001051 [Picochlorum sp. BPE23]|nr:hypothetical protein M9434_001051 [Picochlorum sp. BPE23]